jgi:hypothetical protein
MTLPKAFTQRIALRQALDQDGYHEALLKVAAGDAEVLAKWSEPLTPEERADRRKVILDLWLAGATEPMISTYLRMSGGGVHESIGQSRLNYVEEVRKEEPPIYNVWNFSQCDPRFGQKHPGQIPGQAVLNLLLWLTKPFDFVVDPMGGGGTTVDVCKYLNRRYKVFDIDPRRPDIHQHDISIGYPKLPSKPDFIFLDPPYWRLMRDQYSQDGSAMGSYEGWLAFMGKVAKDSAKTVRPGGHVSLMIESFLDEKESGKFLFVNRDCLNLFEKAGLEGIQEISVNMPSQIKSFRDVVYAKKHKILLDLKRELFVFRRPEIAARGADQQ